MKFFHDRFKSARGGHSRALDIRCRKCGAGVLFYQKDGPGVIRRLYMDRILSPKILQDNKHCVIGDIDTLRCGECREVLAHPYVYKKENRNAYRVFQDALIKKVVSLKEVPDE